MSQIKGLKPWRQEIAGAAVALRAVMIPKHQAVTMSLDFFFERPASVSIRKRPHMVTAPDLDKLQRAVFDAIKGILIHDDAQIVDVGAHKHYGSPARVEIAIGEL
jgi:crossover junction endodeoxyribonuclease RusA